MAARKRPNVSSFLSNSSKALETQKELEVAQERISELETALSESRERICSIIGEERITQAIVPISSIHRRTHKSRREREPEFFNSLVVSIKEYGFRGSIWVQQLPDGELRLIAGETRLDAAQAAGLDSIPVDIADVDDITAVKLSRVENSRRRSLNALDDTEELLYLLSLVLELSREETIKTLYKYKNALEGNSRITSEYKEKIEAIFSEVTPELSVKTFVSSRLPLIDLAEEVLDAYEKNLIQYTKAILISRIENQDLRAEILDAAIRNNLSLSALKALIRERTGKNIHKHRQLSQVEKQHNTIQKIKVEKLNKTEKKELKKLLIELQQTLEEKLSQL